MRERNLEFVLQKGYGTGYIYMAILYGDVETVYLIRSAVNLMETLVYGGKHLDEFVAIRT